MRHSYDVTLVVKVTDPRDLFNAALETYLKDNSHAATEADYSAYIGTRANPDVSGCLRMLADPGVSWPGTEIEDSTAEFQMDLGGDYGDEDDDDDAPLDYRYDAGTAVLFTSTASDATTAPDTLVVIVRPLSVGTEDEEGEADREVGPMYRVSDKDGNEYDAFEDELSAPASIIHTLPEDWQGAPLA